MVWKMEVELCFILMADLIKEILLMIWKVGKDFSICQMGPHIKGNLGMGLKMGKGLFSGLMEKFMMGNGLEERRMEVECGKAQKGTHT